MFDKELHDNYNKKFPFAANKLFYNQEKDCYICPMGQQMEFMGTATKITATGFKQTVKRYQAKNCTNCPLNGACHKSKVNWVIMINEILNQLEKESPRIAEQRRRYPAAKETMLLLRTNLRKYQTEPRFSNVGQTVPDCPFDMPEQVGQEFLHLQYMVKASERIVFEFYIRLFD